MMIADTHKKGEGMCVAALTKRFAIHLFISCLQANAIKEAALLKLELEDARVGLTRVRTQYEEAAVLHGQELAKYRVRRA